MLPGAVEDDEARAGGALIDRATTSHSVSWHAEKFTATGTSLGRAPIAFHGRGQRPDFVCERTRLNACAQFRFVYMEVQEGFAKIPGQSGGFGMVAGARVAEETMVRFRDFHIDIRFGEPLTLVRHSSNLRLRNVLIPAAPEK